MKLQNFNKVEKLSKHWMIAGIASFLIICNSLIFPNIALAQSSDTLPTLFSLEDLSEFKNAPRNWHLAGDIYYHLNNEKTSKEEKGKGIIINHSKGGDNGDLLTNFEHGDIDLEFDFMLPKGSTTGVYLQSRYGIRLNDSWSNAGSIVQASGAIYLPYKDNKQLAQVIPPRMNVCKAPGLWQNLKVSFQAPKFDNTGKKVSNAKFNKVVYNGVVIHANIDLQGVNAQRMPGDETPLAPLMFSGNSDIAIRNIRYKMFADSPGTSRSHLHFASSLLQPTSDRPIIIEPEKRTIVQRCFIEDGQKKSTFCVAVGEPGQIHYAMDLSQGAIINLWKGGFLDATTMWTGRGGEQLARPLGSKIELSNAPAFAILQNTEKAWPASMQKASNYQFKSYQLDEHGRPTFKYLINGFSIEDKVTPQNNDQYLTRTLKVKGGNDTRNLWFRLAKGRKIELLPDGFYGIDDKNYYIKVHANKKEKPLIRKVKDGEELLIPVILTGEQSQLEYSIIW